MEKFTLLAQGKQNSTTTTNYPQIQFYPTTEGNWQIFYNNKNNIKNNNNKKNINNNNINKTYSINATIAKRRKLVICYFRDKNGDLIIDALQKSGFDVLLFERGYHKGISNTNEERMFGKKWVVNSKQIPSLYKNKQDGNNGIATKSLDEYWQEVIKNNKRDAIADFHQRNHDETMNIGENIQKTEASEIPKKIV